MLPRNNFLLSSLMLFAAAMIIGGIIFMAYPYGFITIETPNWWENAERSAKNFYLFSKAEDWWRTIPYGVVMHLTAVFPNPTGALFWLHTILFALNVVLTFWLGQALFRSDRLGFALASTFLLFETVAMRMLFFNLQVNADPFFAELVCLGCLLSLCGWLRRSKTLSMIGYAVFGLTLFTKAAGSFLLLVWLPFALLTFRSIAQERHPRAFLTALLLLISAPMIFLCSRNYIMYGCAKPSAASSFMILAKAFGTMSDTDKVLEYPEFNKDFMDEYHKLVDFYWHDDFSKKYYPRLDHYLDEAYFQDRVRFGPYNLMAHIHTGELLNRWDSRQMFALDRPLLRAAGNIIWQHPMAFSGLCLGEYYRMFQPLEAITIESEKFSNSTEKSYEETVGWSQWYPPYPPHGRVYTRHSNQEARHLLELICLNPLAIVILQWFYGIQFILCHACFIAALTFFAFTWWKRSKYYNDADLRHCMAVMLMLFLTAAVYNAQVAVVELARTRYMMASELSLHLFLLIGAFYLVHSVARGRNAAPDAVAQNEPASAISDTANAAAGEDKETIAPCLDEHQPAPVPDSADKNE